MSNALRDAIDACLAGADRRAVARAAALLSEAYRGSPDRPTARLDAAARLAYLAVRFPATFAAVGVVAREAARAIDFSGAETLLELGSGPGPARWAFAPVLPRLRRAHLVDRDAGLLDLARALASHADPRGEVALITEVADLSRLNRVPEADVVVLSYAVGEIAAAQRAPLVARAWKAARVALVVVEPGTTPGFARVIEARRLVVEAGAHVAAPCPHDLECPMDSPDWCHFPVRLERSRLHQQVKGAALGFEDEKFAYVVASRAPVRPVSARVVARPEGHGGHVALRLCTREGLETRRWSKRHGDEYRRARRLEWGDGA